MVDEPGSPPDVAPTLAASIRLGWCTERVGLGRTEGRRLVTASSAVVLRSKMGRVSPTRLSMVMGISGPGSISFVCMYLSHVSVNRHNNFSTVSIRRLLNQEPCCARSCTDRLGLHDGGLGCNRPVVPRTADWLPLP